MCLELEHTLCYWTKCQPHYGGAERNNHNLKSLLRPQGRGSLFCILTFMSIQDNNTVLLPAFDIYYVCIYLNSICTIAIFSFAPLKGSYKQEHIQTLHKRLKNSDVLWCPLMSSIMSLGLYACQKQSITQY